MENLIGVVILAVGVYFNVYGTSDLDSLKAYAGMIGGSAYLLWNNFSYLKSLITNKKDKSNPEQIFSPKEYELYDTNCLVHLRNRCIENNSVEGVETCAKLNTIMFGFKKVNKEQTVETKNVE